MKFDIDISLNLFFPDVPPNLIITIRGVLADTESDALQKSAASLSLAILARGRARVATYVPGELGHDPAVPWKS